MNPQPPPKSSGSGVPARSTSHASDTNSTGCIPEWPSAAHAAPAAEVDGMAEQGMVKLGTRLEIASALAGSWCGKSRLGNGPDLGHERGL